MTLGQQMKRLARHSAIYGVGGLISRILATVLLPLYTHYLTPHAYGQVEIVTAATAVLAIVLQLGIANAFFRFYFDTRDPAARLTVVRTSFWFVMTTSTAGLVISVVFAGPIGHWIGLGHDPTLVRAGAVGLWAQTNYQQLTNLFRAEERSVSYAIASVANVLITVAAMVVFVAIFHWGPVGLVVGNFTGTLAVYVALVAYRSEQLGLEFDWSLYRKMEHFGLPLVPSALALWAINFIDREFIVWFKNDAEVGVYSAAIKIASVITFVLIAFRTAWPAFAFSIEEDEEAKSTYAYVLTYLIVVCSWIAAALALLAPWIVEWLAKPAFASASRVVGPLSFAAVAFAGYMVISIGIGRARRTQFNWLITGVAGAANIGLCFALIPSYGMMGAAVATVVSYVIMFLGMAWWAQRIFPVPYQWRRVATASAVAIALVAAGKLAGAGLVVSALLALAYPLALAPFAFYLPAERRRLRALVAR